MNSLSDNLRHIGDSWAITGGRYAGISPMNQRLLSTTSNKSWEIERGHLAAAKHFLGHTPRA